MLQFLQTGKALYVFAVLCGIGIMSKLVTGSLYKRMVKETANMTLTKNRNLKALKQKTENMFLISHGIRNAGAYIEKQMYCFRFMGMGQYIGAGHDPVLPDRRCGSLWLLLVSV